MEQERHALEAMMQQSSQSFHPDKARPDLRVSEGKGTEGGPSSEAAQSGSVSLNLVVRTSAFRLLDDTHAEENPLLILEGMMDQVCAPLPVGI